MIWNNIKKHQFSSKIQRETFTGLPYEILDEIAGKNADGRTMEDLIEIAGKYLRQLVDQNKMDVPEAIALYYCGEDAVSNAKFDAYKAVAKPFEAGQMTDEMSDNISRKSNQFWNYCIYLPEGRGRELAILAVVNSAYEHTASFADGWETPEYLKRMALSKKYKELTGIQAISAK